MTTTQRPTIFSPGDGFPGVNASNWNDKREELRRRITPYLGVPTCLDPDWKVKEITVVEENDHPVGRLTKLTYETEPGEPVSAWLLVPHGLTAPAPAVLCLHGTAELAKDTQIWGNVPEKPNRDFAVQLAKLGFVTFAPDHLAAGERRLDPSRISYDTHAFYERHPAWSEAGKMIWDAGRAIDAMSLIPAIDASRIGAVGHSLGGYGSFIAAAFEERLKAIVSSCGLTTWEGNPLRFKWAREEWYRHFPALRSAFSREELPFELYELAALVAPRAFLNISGMMDPIYGLENNCTLPEAGRRLAELYRQVGHPEKFANFLFGGVHEVPIYCCDLIGGWFRRWLQMS